jgi:hypothetical protein
VTVAIKVNHSPKEIPSGIGALGFVLMLIDVSSEMIHGLLPIYVVTVLGTSMITVGVIEGIAEAAASITRIFSGKGTFFAGACFAFLAFAGLLAARGQIGQAIVE